MASGDHIGSPDFMGRLTEAGIDCCPGTLPPSKEYGRNGRRVWESEKENRQVDKPLEPEPGIKASGTGSGK